MADETQGGPSARVSNASLSPWKALRLAWMARLLLIELRAMDLDEHTRARLRHIYQQSIAELHDALGPQLTSELDNLLPAFDDDVPSQSDLQIAQAQLAGWLEGLMRGVHAALWTQQLTAQRQLEELQAAAARERTTPSTTAPYL